MQKKQRDEQEPLKGPHFRNDPNKHQPHQKQGGQGSSGVKPRRGSSLPTV